MKHRDNKLLEEMVNNPIPREKRDKLLNFKVTESEYQCYRDLMDDGIDIPFMVREFLVKLHDHGNI